MPISRRDFIGAGAAAAAGVTLPKIAGAMPVITVRERSEPVAGAFAGRPVIVSAANGFDKDPSGKQGIRVAYDMLTRGSDPLEAIVAGVQIVELNPNDQSVGLAGLPNEDGVVQLDASCMHGPTKRAGSVGCLEDVAEAAAVAKAIMDHTDHIMLVGAGAKKFAIEMGFKTQNLLTEQSRRDWLRWKAKLNPSDNWLDPVDPPPGPTAPAGAKRPSPDNQYSGVHVYRDASGVPYTYGTINMNAVTATGDIASVTTTSGLSWKIPGRVGDSPIIGAGQYCDNEVGAAGSTGRGEANIKVCGAFLAVEFMRQGMSPQQALMKVMERVIAMTEKRLLDERGRPYFQLQYYAVNKKGEYAGACAYEGSKFAVADANGARLEDCAYLFKRSEQPKGPISGTMIKP
ncbi:MAG TPA: N(4)-(beta-N-acetylglucosaminyl)-L-asparaginase [Gemmatimonadaceae bacterium]|jgi:N4-(beta-N-acetylglucosaminyl)-L-asparaginase|nr:N(4)-(beta-N-acetylglucosaminyl)-L-asparaginase [Gemmatimonadaceae bacterium]